MMGLFLGMMPRRAAPSGAPGAFTFGMWSVSAGDTSATVTVSALPSGAAITAIQYRLNGGAWAAFSTPLTGTGSRTITGLVNGTSYSVEVRAVNAGGPGTDSDDKIVTPVAAYAAALDFSAPLNSQYLALIFED